jgi:hypothetical protein
VLAALAASLTLAVGAAACGSSGGPTGPASAPPPRIGAVAVEPPAGPVGTTFTLTAGGLKEGEAVAFEITFPGQGKAYPGAALTVPADGTASTTYRATTANQPGDYLVRLTGPPGSLAEGKFTVTDGPPILGAMPSDTATSTSTPATTARTGTTSRYGRTTTTVKGGITTTSTTIKGATTTITTKRTTTSLPTVTTRTTLKP